MTAAAFFGLVDVGEPNVVKYVRKDQMEGEQMVIETERLLLRPWADADAPALYRMASDERVGPAAGWPVHESEDESLHIIRTVLSGGSVFCIELKETGSPAGCAGLTMPKDSFLEMDDDEAELGYWVDPACWGQGIAQEAAMAVLDFGFETAGLQAIWCAWFEGNERSGRVQEKCGFTYQYTMEDLWWIPMNDIRTEHVSRITRQEWLARTGERSADI